MLLGEVNYTIKCLVLNDHYFIFTTATFHVVNIYKKTKKTKGCIVQGPVLKTMHNKVCCAQ